MFSFTYFLPTLVNILKNTVLSQLEIKRRPAKINEKGGTCGKQKKRTTKNGFSGNQRILRLYF
jgi:hypothetical protein